MSNNSSVAINVDPRAQSHGGHNHGGGGHGHTHHAGCNHDHGGQSGHGHSHEPRSPQKPQAQGGHGHSHGGGGGGGGHKHHAGCNHGHGGDDHGHGHGHGDLEGGHGHAHGQGGHGHGMNRNQWLKSHGLEIKCFAYGMMLAVWTAICFALSDPLKPGFERLGSQLIITFLAGMAAISYYVCSNTNTYNPSKNPPAHAATPQPCKTCEFWKPERTHHCSACGSCVLRMDHHCPWVVNCVGYRNHKSFLLFCIYLGLGSLFYDYRLVYYLVVTIKDDTFFDNSVMFIIGLVILTILATPIGLMVTGLSTYHFGLALNNLTTLESMGGGNMKHCLESKESADKKFVNKFDRGMLGNLSVFFGNTYIWWWFPTAPKYFFSGQVYDHMGTPTPTELLDHLRGKTNEESMEEKVMKPKSLAEVDLENIFRIGEDFTKDKHLQFFDKMLEIGKRRDHTYREPEKKEIVQPKKEEPVEPAKKESEEQEKDGAVVVSEHALSDQKSEGKEDEAVHVEGI